MVVMGIPLWDDDAYHGGDGDGGHTGYDDDDDGDYDYDGVGNYGDEVNGQESWLRSMMIFNYICHFPHYDDDGEEGENCNN